MIHTRLFRLITAGVFLGLLTSACASTDVSEGTFKPKSQYPPDPWVKGYSNPDDCLGGEKLAAIDFALPDYPRSLSLWSTRLGDCALGC